MKMFKLYTAASSAPAAASTFSLVKHFLWKLVIRFLLQPRKEKESLVRLAY